MKVSQGIGLAALTLGMVIGLAAAINLLSRSWRRGQLRLLMALALPFDREAQIGGISPTNSVVPPGAQAPVGTPIVIRLRKPLSSARVHSNDSFAAILDEPLIVNDRILAERGTLVTGRVVEARIHKPSAYTGIHATDALLDCDRWQGRPDSNLQQLLQGRRSKKAVGKPAAGWRRLFGGRLGHRPRAGDGQCDRCRKPFGPGTRCPVTGRDDRTGTPIEVSPDRTLADSSLGKSFLSCDLAGLESVSKTFSFAPRSLVVS